MAVKSIGKISVTSTEQRIDMAVDRGGFPYLVIEATADVDISVNTGDNYLTYKANTKYCIPDVVEIYIKTTSTANVNYWVFEARPPLI